MSGCTVDFTLLFGCLAILSPIVVINVGLPMAAPYVNTKHFSEGTTPCTVVRVKIPGLISCSYMDEDYSYNSKYLCLIISVNYTDLESGEIITNSTLFAGPYEYWILKTDGCSVYSCDPVGAHNDKVVAEFQRKYGSLGQTFPCHPGPRLDREAILSVIPLWRVLLGLLLPASIFIVSLTYLVVLLNCCETA